MTRQEEFQEELRALLKKYDAEICLQDSGVGYQPDYTMAFYGSAKWDKDGKIINESFEFTGSYFDGGEK